MTDGWATMALGELVDLRLSSVDKKSKPDETPVLLCNYTDVYRNRIIHSDLDFMEATATDREIEKCALQPGDVVITKDSEQYDDIGVPALIRDDAPALVCGYHLAILRPRHDLIDGGYLFNALTTREVQHQFHAFANGVTRFGLRKADIERVQIPVPPMEEQRRIAGVLGCLDDKIELNRRMAETLEQMARALFRSWFVDFEPVRAKQEGRWCPGQSLPGLPAHLYEAFPGHLEPSELGPIPAGWRVARVADLCSKIENGGTPKRREAAYWGGSIDWFTTSELADGPLIESKEKITESGLSRSSCKLWEPGTVLIALYASPTVGRLGILETPAASNQACSGLIAKPEIGRLFLFHSLLATRDRLRDIAVGAAQQNISQKVVRDHPAITPPASVIKAFDGAVDCLWQRRVECARDARALAASRDTLLACLLSA